MKPFVFMCLTVAGMAVGLFIGVKTEPGIDYTFGGSLAHQRSKQATHLAVFSLGGAAIGAGFGWMACRTEKLKTKD